MSNFCITIQRYSVPELSDAMFTVNEVINGISLVLKMFSIRMRQMMIPVCDKSYAFVNK